MRLVTDAWVRPGSLASHFPSNAWRQRYHAELDSQLVTSWNINTAAFELSSKAFGRNGWDLILRRNRWFQHHVTRTIERLGNTCTDFRPPILFSYSYTALEPFRWARAEGWTTVLGQIDPGPAHSRIVSESSTSASIDELPPPIYWDDWREECVLADQIIVNSTWSRDALVSDGVSPEKIVVIPLAYSPPAESQRFCRSYPSAFSASRPLRVLFLGQVSLAKGMQPLVEAIRRLQHEPVEFWIVGPELMNFPSDVAALPCVQRIPAIPRASAADYYRKADVFIFPTLSDGFGLTQLEAQAWKLPVVASRFCGDVVENGRNGFLLEEVTGDDIAQALLKFVAEPSMLIVLSERSHVDERFSLKSLANHLIRLGASN